jgi:septum formation protein
VPHPAIVLGSASPRRRELLASLGLTFTVAPADVDETLLPGENPFDAAERLARAKAEAAAERAPSEALVIAADTLVVLDGKALGKPRDRAEAAAMLRSLSGRRHEVVTGVALVRGSVMTSGREVTEVVIAPLADDEIARYAATGEPDDKAGAYAMQGIGGLLIERVEGSPSNVIGLPVRLLGQLAARLGVSLL